MPPKKSAPSTSKKSEKPMYWCDQNAPWGGFINVRMDDDLKDQFYTWYEENQQQVIPSMVDMMALGLKFSQSWDDENQAFIVTVTGALVQPYPDRYCVTSRAGTLGEALGLSVWKHYIFVRGDYGAYMPSKGEFKRFG